ncbi:MAG: aquaporin [Ardenticatenaceae bacterium]|nr:aquaporin [Anaerolineales bacterium]MCB8940245.1 aquaporin [Ardenticatenaceae bacterium]MCB8973260.1 aquaporin [Ardenticatenaceae bacterium]
MNTKALVAEFIGTFTLIFIGAGAGAIGAGGLVGVALAHGLVVLGFAYAYGHISGTHINPAVTFGMLVGKQIDVATAVGYWVVQFLGGIVGAFVLSFVLGGADSGLGATVLASGVSPVQGIVVEIILTFFLVNAIFNTAVSGKAGNLAPVAIGLTLAFSILMGGPLTGASLNPARTLGPAIASGNFADIWLYFVGPLVGAAAAALLYTGLLKPNK